MCHLLWKAGFFLRDPSLFMAGTARFRSAESESFILVGENSLPPSNILNDRFNTQQRICSCSFVALSLRFVDVPQGQGEGNCTLHSPRINPMAQARPSRSHLSWNFDFTSLSVHRFYHSKQGFTIWRMDHKLTITMYGTLLTIDHQSTYWVVTFKSPAEASLLWFWHNNRSGGEERRDTRE